MTQMVAFRLSICQAFAFPFASIGLFAIVFLCSQLNKSVLSFTIYNSIPFFSSPFGSTRFSKTIRHRSITSRTKCLAVCHSFTHLLLYKTQQAKLKLPRDWQLMNIDYRLIIFRSMVLLTYTFYYYTFIYI